MAGSPVFGRPYKDKVPGQVLVLAATGGDPLTGAFVAVPQWAHSYSVYVTGAGPIWLRQQDSNDLATDPPSATTCHTYPGAVILGPFPVDKVSGADTPHVVIAKATGGTVTAYFINWYR